MKNLIWLAALLIPVTAVAGKKDKKSKKEKVNTEIVNYFETVAPVGDDITVGLEDAIGGPEEAKLKVRLLNGTRDWLIYRAGESRFDFGDGELTPTRAKMAFIPPKSAKARVIAVKGTGFQKPSFTFMPNGIYKVPDASVSPFKVNDLQLPLEVSTFESGPFDCDIPGKVKQQTDETKFRVVCTYKGEEIGLVDPSKIQVRIEDGQLFANDDRKTDPMIVTEGDEFKFDVAFHVSGKIVDMQFAKLHVVFNDTFQGGKTEPVPFSPIELTIDQALTNEKND